MQWPHSVSGFTTKSDVLSNPIVKMKKCFISVEHINNVLIGDYTHNAMSRLLSGQTSMSDVPKYATIDIKIMEQFQFSRRLHFYPPPVGEGGF